MQTQLFHLGDILSITTGQLVSKDHIFGVYKILNFMTSDNLFTYHLPWVVHKCKSHLLEQYPELETSEMGIALATLSNNLADVKDYDGQEQVIRDWLASQVEKYGETLKVTPIPNLHLRSQ